jgi:hypothetical protein
MEVCCQNHAPAAFLQDKNTQFLSQRKLGKSGTDLSRSISIPRLVTGYSKPSSDYAVMTTAPGRSVHVGLETSELKRTSRQLHTPDPLSPTEELTPTYKVIRQQSVGSEVTLRLKAVNDISTKHLWNDDCQET